MNRLNYLRKEARRMHILGHIINCYVSNAAPVSSRFVARRMGGNVSSATIRNVMGELEDQGFIEQPHTSAGRIPTNSGYRLFVDMIRERIKLEKAEAGRLEKEYTERIRSMEEVIKTTSRIISRELRNAGIVMWPGIGDYNLKHIELIKVRAETVLAVLVTMTNAVQEHLIALDKDLEKAELQAVSDYLNSRFENRPVIDIARKLEEYMKDAVDENGGVLSTARNALCIVDSMIAENIGNDICWEGLNYFLEESEGQEARVAHNILKLFSCKNELVRLLKSELLNPGLKVHIGGEDGFNMLNDCTMITCGYELHGRCAGRLGVIGSTRMDYERALGVMSCLSDLVSMKLETING